MANFWGRQGVKRRFVGPPDQQSLGPRPHILTLPSVPAAPGEEKGAKQGGWGRRNLQGQNDSGTPGERGPAGCWGSSPRPRGFRPRSGATEGRAAPGRDRRPRAASAAPPGRGHHLTILPAPGRRAGERGPWPPPASRAGALSYRWGGEELAASPPAPSLALKPRAPAAAAAAPDPSPHPDHPLPALPAPPQPPPPQPPPPQRPPQPPLPPESQRRARTG